MDYLDSTRQSEQTKRMQMDL